MNFVKENPFFVVVTAMVAMIVSFAFAISFKSMVEVAETLHVSLPYIYPLLFEVTSIVGGSIKAYLEVKGIEDRFTQALANIMLYTGVLLSVALNVYHVVGYMSVDTVLESVFLVIAHSVPSLLVVGGAEVIIALGRHTFANNETTEATLQRIQELIDELSTTNENLATVTGQNTTLIEQNEHNSQQLQRFDKMPKLLKAFLAVHNEEMEVAELNQLFGFTQARYTRLAKQFEE